MPPLRSPLHLAASLGRVEDAAVLAEEGARTEAVDSEGRTPAEVAEAAGHRGLAALLAGREGSAE